MSGSEDRRFAKRIRPYLLTGGRTKSDIDLPLETQIRSTSGDGANLSGLADESRAIVELCATPNSVAEISARCKLHLQVARILIADLVSAGHVVAGDTAVQSERPDLGLLERVLDGLQAL